MTIVKESLTGSMRTSWDGVGAVEVSLSKSCIYLYKVILYMSVINRHGI